MSKENPFLVIPMCGIGKRFKAAKYGLHKSLLEVKEKSMLERVIHKFDGSIETFIITTKDIYQEISNSSKLKILEEKYKIIYLFIEPHSLGPGYSIYKAFDSLPLNRPFFISYCDITWDYKGEISKIPEKNIDAAIFTHQGFHPHSVNNNFSAFCLPEKTNQRILSKIKEKSSFTDAWMNEQLSIGLFYIKNTKIAKKSLFQMIDDKNLVNGEYFPSLMFNYINESGIKVELISVNSFAHYGTPKHFQDINNWSDYFEKKRSIYRQSKIKHLNDAIIFTSGKGNRMKKISNLPKPLIKTKGETLLEKVVDSLPIDREKIHLIFNELKTPLNFLSKNTNYVNIGSTSSQYDSLKAASDYIKNVKSFLLCSCDCYGYFDFLALEKMKAEETFDVICFGFEPSLIQLQTKSNYSTFEYFNEQITKINVKKISGQSHLGLAGFFWIRDGDEMIKYISNFQNKINDREIIVDDVINDMLKSNKKIGFIHLHNYLHLGSEIEFKEYNYWQNHIQPLLKSSNE